jgi:uroporphyrin-III C-methyltransferase
MPGQNYADMSSRLRAAGLASDTPCAIVSRATMPDQQTFRTSVGKLQLSPTLPAPTLLVVGNVVRHAAAEQFQFASSGSEISIPELVSVFRAESIQEEPVA